MNQVIQDAIQEALAKPGVEINLLLDEASLVCPASLRDKVIANNRERIIFKNHSRLRVFPSSAVTNLRGVGELRNPQVC